MTGVGLSWRRRLAYAAFVAIVAPLFAVGTGGPASAVSPNIVISQVYGGGGNSGATYTHDFVELFNRSDAPVSVDGWSVQYASATGTGHFATNVTVLSGVIEPGRYYLVRLAQGAGGTTPLPTPDAIGTTAMSASSGKVIVALTSTGLACNGGSTPCSASELSQIIDLVGYGSANFFEGSAAAPTLSNTTAALREGDGAVDTDNNAADFVAGAPNPRNSGSPPPPPPPPSGCDTPAGHEIAAVQGSGATTPLAGQTVRVEGIVTGDFQATSQLRGFFLQDPTPDADPATSDGLFAFGGSTDVAVGDRVLVTGRAIEFNGLTELSPVDAVDVCGTGTIAPTGVDLPRAPGTTFEPLESVLTTFPETLTVSEHFQLGRFGEVTVASEGRLFQPTERAEPGADAVALAELAARRRLLIDDGSTVQNPATVPYLTPEAVRIGDSASGITGVLGFGFNAYRLQPTAPISFARTNPRPAGPQPVGGDVRVASFNTLNYFTTLGSQNPNARGADTAEEFARQQAKEVAAITALDSDVIGLMEVENNGATAVGNLVDALNAATAPGTYAYVTEPVLNPPNEFGGEFGTDAIKVAIIYRPAAVTPVGAARTSADPVFSRPPLIQTFRRVTGSEPFTVVVNHFKSKSCGGATGADLDQGDGQACYNATRVAQSTALVNALDELAVPNPLVVGDLNAYTREDPIDVLEHAGYVGLTPRFIPDADRYSFVFDGFSGELDHALAGPSLADNVTGAAIWHINADEPNILDYNTEFNPPSLYQPNAFRSSDHDPLVVGLRLDVPPAVVQVTVLAGWHAATVSWQAPADDGGSPITGYELRVLRDGVEVATASVGPAVRSYTFGGLDTGVAYTFEVRARNAVGAGPAGTATGTPFKPNRYAALEARAVCGGTGGALYDVVNSNPYPISFDWRVLRGTSGTGVVAASSSTRIEVPRATVGVTKVRISVDGVRHDETNAC
ncbi:MAG: ExeM/NucH family extracellular endonuclease [Micromonosporaceae bacterium]